MSNVLNLASVMIGTMPPEVLGEFYEKIFERKPDMDEDGWKGWKIGSGFLTVGEHSEMAGKACDPARVMFNLETADVKGEFARMQAAGAKVVAEPYEMQGAWIATLADPDENYFQLMSPWEPKMEK